MKINNNLINTKEFIKLIELNDDNLFVNDLINEALDNRFDINKEIINGLIAQPRDCNIPCTATEKPIKMYPILAILSEIVQTSIISLPVPPDNANKLDSGFAKISKIIVRINVTSAVSIIPYLIQSLILSLSFIPQLNDNIEIIVLDKPNAENNAICCILQ